MRRKRSGRPIRLVSGLPQWFNQLHRAHRHTSFSCLHFCCPPDHLRRRFRIEVTAEFVNLGRQLGLPSAGSHGGDEEPRLHAGCHPSATRRSDCVDQRRQRASQRHVDSRTEICVIRQGYESWHQVLDADNTVRNRRVPLLDSPVDAWHDRRIAVTGVPSSLRPADRRQRCARLQNRRSCSESNTSRISVSYPQPVRCLTTINRTYVGIAIVGCPTRRRRTANRLGWALPPLLDRRQRCRSRSSSSDAARPPNHRGRRTYKFVKRAPSRPELAPLEVYIMPELTKTEPTSLILPITLGRFWP